jgi:adenine phosphoribosyltransferase
VQLDMARKRDEADAAGVAQHPADGKDDGAEEGDEVARLPPAMDDRLTGIRHDVDQMEAWVRASGGGWPASMMRVNRAWCPGLAPPMSTAMPAARSSRSVRAISQARRCRGGQVGQHDQHLLGAGGLQCPQPFVERARRLDRPRAGGGKNDVLAPPRGFHQPCCHRTRILPSHPQLCNTPARDAKLRAPPGPARLPHLQSPAPHAERNSNPDQGPHPPGPGFSQAGHPVLRHFHLLAHAQAWHATVDILAAAIRPHRPDLLVGIESRGFLVAAPLALKLDCGFVMVRKKGKLPGATIPHSYQLEYGTDTVEVQADAVSRGQRVVVLDDLLATGGTMSAAIALLQKVGADVRAAACIIELAFLNGRSKLSVPFVSVVSYES